MYSQSDLSLIGVGWESVRAEGHYLCERLPPSYVCQFSFGDPALQVN